MTITRILCSLLMFAATLSTISAEEPAKDIPQPSTIVTKAFIDGQGDGWADLTEADFTNVNCADDTWSWKDGMLYCTGKPVGVMRTKEQVVNFELVLHWRHMKSAGNSGVFVWATPESIEKLKPGGLPQGIEVQILDHGYTEKYEKSTGKKATWFTSNGDVFPVGSKMKVFKPTSPDGSRSFPKKNLSKGFGEWNHYYVRGINGEVRLWVNGEEVSGGSDASPAKGYLCLESEGSPIEFKNIRIRKLP